MGVPLYGATVEGEGSVGIPEGLQVDPALPVLALRPWTWTGSVSRLL